MTTKRDERYKLELSSLPAGEAGMTTRKGFRLTIFFAAGLLPVLFKDRVQAKIITLNGRHD